MIDIAILNKLNAPTKEERLANLKEVLKDTTFQSICPFETTLCLYYMDAEKGERLLLSDKFLLVPAVL